MAHLTADLATAEEMLGDTVDVDASWSYKKSDGTTTASSSSIPPATPTELLIDGEVLYDFDSTLIRSETDTPPSKEMTPSLRTVSTTSIAVEEQRGSRNGSNPKLVNGIEDSRIHRGLDERANSWAGALHYLFNVDPKGFATDLTRVQWQLFVAIRVSIIVQISVSLR